MFGRINILEALKQEQKELNSRSVLGQVNDVLSADLKTEQQISNNINRGDKNFSGVTIIDPDPDRLFSLEAIKKVCVNYRLRFLDADLFKGDIPYEAIIKAKHISRQSESELKSFKIMAPSRLFKLTDADADPLLFVPTADGNYYLIHKWGTDLSWYKKLLHFPSRSLGNLVATILFFAFIAALITPNDWLVPPSFMATNNVFGYWGFHRISFFFHATILMCGMTVFYWFAFHKNFSNAEWNKKTFN